MYKSKFITEAELPEWFDKKITKLLQVLKDEDFGNESQRKKLIDILSTLHNSSDVRSRKAFKAIGDLFSEIGDELIKYGQEENK